MHRSVFVILIFFSSSGNAARIWHQTLGNGTELIAINGAIESGDEAAFKKLAIQYDKALVGLSSNGGALQPALEIGMALHLRGYSTAVAAGDQCASACALIWAGGVNRYLVKGGRVGFHASYTDEGGKVVETGLGNALVGRYLTQLGLPEQAIIFATAAHPESIAWLDKQEDAATSGFPFEYSTPSAREQGPAVANAAVAGTNEPYTNVRGWSIYRNSDNCLAMRNYERGLLVVRYDAKPQLTTISFSYPEGTSLKDGDEKPVRMYFLRQNGSLDSGWATAQFKVQIIGSEATLSSPGLQNPALSDIRSAKTVGFFYNDKVIRAFNLTGNAEALDEVKRCSMQVNNLNPKDVFAN
jgi:hypothetical protein